MKHLILDDCPCPHCRTGRAWRAARPWLFMLICVGLLAWAVLVLTGCTSTVTPAPVAASQASYDQGEQNSGLLRLIDGGAVITPRARERYNALIMIYGGEFLPPLQRDQGITPSEGGTFFITNEALQRFILMNAWRRMGHEPGKPRTPTP